MHKIAIFASGTGSNAAKIIEYFKEHDQIEVALIVSNKKSAPVLQIATANNIPSVVIDKDEFYTTLNLLDTFEGIGITFIVLAGFLWLVPEYLLRTYKDRIVNIHPSLLPKFGGKGMYGMNVHRAVKAAGETQTGITIHYVNENYDEGKVIFQAQTLIDQEETPEDIAKKVQRLEHQHFAVVIESLLRE